MNNMDANLVLICSNLSAHALGGIDRAADDLAELGERAKARGIRIGFEALAWGVISMIIATPGKRADALIIAMLD